MPDLPHGLDRRESKPKPWRDVFKVHPAADMFPMMTEAELIELGEDIKKSGLKVPIVLSVDRVLLDGRNRLAAMKLVGLPTDSVSIRYEHGDPYAFVISANIHRRHLTADQKRELIAKFLTINPEKSNRQIAEIVGRDHKTVAAVRIEKERRGEIPHVETRTDTKGRKQPTKKPKKAIDSTTFNPTTGSVAVESISPPGPYHWHVHEAIKCLSWLAGIVEPGMVANHFRDDRLVVEKGQDALTWLTKFMEAWEGRP